MSVANWDVWKGETGAGNKRMAHSSPYPFTGYFAKGGNPAMLVVISDLHFTDGTTSNYLESEKPPKDLFNVSPKAFQIFLMRIADIIKRRPTVINKVCFVYNGDIFDLLRTNYWFGAPVSEHPWDTSGSNKGALLGHAQKILTAICERNRDALRWLSGTHDDFPGIWPFEVKVERIYIPGNHDRIINLYPELRKTVCASLLGQHEPERDCFDPVHMDADHKTVVMHGHEADVYNCEYDGRDNPVYQAVPIGDPMTTMLFTRLGQSVLTPGISAKAKSQLREIDNVRPTLSVVRYVQNIISGDPGVEHEVSGAVKAIVENFQSLPFYQEWEKKHDRWSIGWDEADKLQDVLRAVKLLGTNVPAGLLEKLAGFLRDDDPQQWADSLLRTKKHNDMLYCVMGHTHEPDHVPLFVGKDGRERHYLNCGTFRTTLSPTLHAEAFVRYQRLSYVIIFGPGEYEKGIDYPVYEMWSGIRMRD